MNRTEMDRELLQTERIEYLPEVQALLFRNFPAQTKLLSCVDDDTIRMIAGAEKMGTIQDSENRKLKVWKIPFGGRVYYMYTHKARGTSYETRNPDGEKCAQFLAFLLGIIE